MLRIWVLLAVVVSGQLFAGQNDRVPAYLLEVPASVGTVLIAETDTSTLHLFSNGDGRVGRDRETYMSIGQNGVGKAREWDGRTPLGVYFINEQLDTSGLHEKYGPVAYPLDYPNTWDRKSGRSGDGIWIHGVTPNSGRRPPLDTDGCIALPNDELLALGPRLLLHETPVVITRSIRWTSPQRLESDRIELRGALDRWVKSIESGDLHLHLSLYDDEFSYRGMNRDEWAAFRMQSVTRAAPQAIVLQDVLLMADPEDEGLYLSRFRQAVAYDGRTVATLKRLYWKRSADGILRIVAEDNG